MLMHIIHSPNRTTLFIIAIVRNKRALINSHHFYRKKKIENIVRLEQKRLPTPMDAFA